MQGEGIQDAAAFVVFFLVVFFTISTCSSPGAVSSTEFTLDPQNIGDSFSLQSLLPQSKFPFVTHDGQIFLTQDPTDGTRDSTLYNVGRVMYKIPIQFKDDEQQILSFDTSFRFKITTATKYNESGDGIAFVMTTDQYIPQNSTGRFIGLMPESPTDRHQRFLAVEFDTFQNLQAEIADPSASHIGIDINNLSSVAYLDTSNQSHPLYLYHNYTFTAWVSYNASTQLIQVWATNSSDSQRPHEPVVSIRCNLSQVFENYKEIYVGIIAASGNNSQAAILYNWNFTVMDNSQASINHKPPGQKSPRHMWQFLVPSVVGVCLFAATTCIVLRRRQTAKRRRKERATIEMSSGGVRRYKYTQLMQATQRFSKEQIIGAGGFSTVYKGVLCDGTQVAVKKMRDGLGMESEMIATEVQIISKIRHRHLLQLQGWCYERGEALLVYEYMPRGGLDSYLYGERRRAGQTVDSEARFKILVGVAAALEYLHWDLPGSATVIHRDVKAANVLLTETMEAMLADFGLSRLIANDKFVTITAAGTPGYVAPEVMQTGRVDAKVDVYSFGVLALEVACGRQALDPSNVKYSRLVDWVWLRHQRTSILDALDPHIAHSMGAVLSSSASSSLSSSSSSSASASASALACEVQEAAASCNYVEDELVQKWRCVLHLGLLCCQAHPDARPCMREVHQALKECKVLAPPLSWTLYPARPHPSPIHNNTSDTSGAASKSSLSLSLFHISR